MDSSSSSDRKDLVDFIAENQLPCYVHLFNNETNFGSGGERKRELFFYKVFKAKSFIAKSYNRSLEKYLLHHRPSTASSAEYLTWTSLAKTTNGSIEFNEISIPLGYKGLFEIFSSNSVKVGGILDHETDIISLAGRLKRPTNYYVAKDLKLYEIVREKSSSVSTALHRSLSTIKQENCKAPMKYSRRWTKFPSGTIIKAVRVVDVDYSGELYSYMKMLKNAFCCKFAKYKSEMAIEFKIIQTFDDLNKTDLINDDLKNANGIHNPNYGKKCSLAEKSFYLPVEEHSQANEALNLIPIANSMEKILKLNSLQTINHFVNMDLNMNLLNLRVFADDPFAPSKDALITKVNNKINQSFNEFQTRQNEHLQIEKLSSVFELFDYREVGEFLIGFDFECDKMFVMPVIKTVNKFLKIGHEGSIKLNEHFFKLAESTIDQFDTDIVKLETFTQNKKLFNNLFHNNYLTVSNNGGMVKRPTISHFADFINAELLEKASCRKQSIGNEVGSKIPIVYEANSGDSGLSETISRKSSQNGEENVAQFMHRRFHSMMELVKNSFQKSERKSSMVNNIEINDKCNLNRLKSKSSLL